MDFGRANHHRIHGEPWLIDPNPWLFHMRYADRDLRRECGRIRKPEYQTRAAVTGTGGAKSWACPFIAYHRERARLADGHDPVELTSQIQGERIEIMLEYYAQHNRIGARQRKSPLYHIPERFAQSL